MAVASRIFKLPATDYVKAVAGQLLFKWLPLLLAVIAILAVAAVYDLRWAYVLLITIFVVYPMLMSFAWIAVCASPDLLLCAHPQRWLFSSQTITVEFFPLNTSVDEDSEDSAPAEPFASATVSTSGIASISTRGKNTIIRLAPDRSDKIRFLIIPTTYIPDGQLTAQ